MEETDTPIFTPLRVFAKLIEEDYYYGDPLRKLSDALKDLAIKYSELTRTALCYEWLTYFALSVEKLVRELPANNYNDVNAAVDKLQREKLIAKARNLGATITFPAPGPINSTGTSGHQDGDNMKTADAPKHKESDNELANVKRPAEDAVGTESPEKQVHASKSAKHIHEAEDDTRGGFNIETEGSVTLRISDDRKISTFKLNGHGPAIVTVNVRKKEQEPSASVSDNSSNEDKTEEEAYLVG